MHLRDGSDELLDEEGKVFDNMDTLRSAVLAAARDVITGDVTDGLIDLRFWIDAEDENGSIVYSLPFKHAVSIISSEHGSGGGA